MRKDLLSTVATVLMVGCAITITGLAVRREFFAQPAAGGPKPERIEDWRPYGKAGHRFGPADAPVTLVVFSDFQCPACRQFASYMPELRKLYPELAIVFRHFPLPQIHPHAIAAVRASECAEQQKRFESYHNALFAAQDSVGLLPWAAFAGRASIEDIDAFEACHQRETPLPTLHRDTVAGNRLGVQGTPTILINDLKLSGVPPLAALHAMIRKAH